MPTSRASGRMSGDPRNTGLTTMGPCSRAGPRPSRRRAPSTGMPHPPQGQSFGGRRMDWRRPARPVREQRQRMAGGRRGRGLRRAPIEKAWGQGGQKPEKVVPRPFLWSRAWRRGTEFRHPCPERTQSSGRGRGAGLKGLRRSPGVGAQGQQRKGGAACRRPAAFDRRRPRLARRPTGGFRRTSHP